MILRTLRRFISLAIIIVVLSGLIYVVTQQSIRQAANDPQIQMAEDAATNKTASAGPPVDINQSLAPYIVIYNASGSPLSGTGMLDGALAQLPPGIFTYTAAHGEDRLTWQPRPGIREAIVIVAFPGGNGFVMAGRSLRETEQREDQVACEVGAVMFSLLGSLLLLEIIFVRISFRYIKRWRQGQSL